MKTFKKIIFIFFIFGLASTAMAATTTSSQVEVNLNVTCPENICLFRGCTDANAVNYDPLAGVDNGTCEYNPDNEEVYGCTDKSATNYNPSATVDNGSCRYSVPNVSNFTAAGVNGRIQLTWRNPTYAKFLSVAIIKSADHFPTGLTDGEKIYDGAGTSFTDTNVSVGVKYYYLAVVKGSDGGSSSGALTSFTIGVVPISGCKSPTALNFNPNATVDDGSCRFIEGPTTGDDGGGGTYTGGRRGPFEELPLGLISTSTKKQLEETARLFVLIQAGEPVKPFFDGSYVKIRANKPFTVSVDYYKMPEVLKTIGVTLYEISDPAKTFSFLLQLNAEKTAYEATIGPLPEDGVYGASIYLINYQDQTIRRYTGQIAVVGSLGILGVGGEKFVTKVAGPVAVTGGALAGFLQLLFAGGAGSWSEIYILLLRQLGAFLGYLGFKKKNRPWGTVYDSITKRPIDPAYVTVLADDQEVATAITDIDGRYGFSLLDGDYRLSAAKTHYVFPSKILAGRNSDEMYGNLYFGEKMHVGAGEIISQNIPLDPIGFDWNEFVKGQGSFLKIVNRQ